LPIALNGGTKVLKFLLKAGKEYVCLMKLHKDVEEDKIREVMKGFIGINIQKPPVRSAVKRVERERTVYYLDVLEIDAASNRGVDDIRALREGVKFSPSSARKKVYIIDEAHMLTTEASNALLKTLEEPATTNLFFLSAPHVHLILPTIVSRCSVVYLPAVVTAVAITPPTPSLSTGVNVPSS